MKHGIIFRDFISKCPNVYTVCVKKRNVRFIDDDLQNKINPFDKRMRCEMRLPHIYKSLNDWIIRNIYMKKRSDLVLLDSPFLRPKNVLVIEDLYDKDNSKAIEIMSLFTYRNKIRLCLVGRECSVTLIDGEEATVINRRVAELCSGTDTNKDSQLPDSLYLKENLVSHHILNLMISQLECFSLYLNFFLLPVPLVIGLNLKIVD